MVFGGKFRITRSNSKASYLPRQSREKLNVDPDHGIYKLTLTSNEDFINHNGVGYSPHHHNRQQQQPQQPQHHHHPQANNNSHIKNNINNINSGSNIHKTEILSAKCNNLPDVLPLGAKVHNHNAALQHPVHPRYGSNNNINMNQHQPPPPYHAASFGSHNTAATAAAAAAAVHLRTPQTAPVHQSPHHNSAYSAKSMFNFNRHSTSAAAIATSTMTTSPLAYSQRGSIGASTDSILAKLVSSSVSSIDLKSAVAAEHPTSHPTTGSTSNSNSNSPVIRDHDPMVNNHQQHHNHRQSSPPFATASAPRSVTMYAPRKLSMDATPVATSAAPSSPAPDAAKEPEKPIIRKDSLKENIDKITQLQSQLMSAHIHEQEKQRESMNGLSVAGGPWSTGSEPLRRASPPAVQRTESVDQSAKTACPIPASPTSPTHINSPVRISPDPQLADVPSKTSYSEASSQTDESALCAAAAASLTDASTATSLSDLTSSSDEDGTSAGTSATTSTTSPASSATLDIDCQKLSSELMRQLAPSDRLHHILAPKAYRSSAFYVTGLYNPYVMPRAVRRDVGTSTPVESPVQSNSSTPVHSGYHQQQQPDDFDIAESDLPPPMPTTPPPTMTRFTREVTHLISTTATPSVDCYINGNGDSSSDTDQPPIFDLTQQKEELCARLASKIVVLVNEQSYIADEAAANELLGVKVARKVTDKIRPVDVSKFRSYVDDVGHITMLLLSLSGRLARTENELQIVDVGDSERKTMEIKRDRLVEQLDEAKRLKEDIDRRGSVVCRILERHLSMDAYADYDYFINMKAKLIVDGREVLDKIKLGEDQLAALRETLVHSEC